MSPAPTTAPIPIPAFAPTPSSDEEPAVGPTDVLACSGAVDTMLGMVLVEAEATDVADVDEEVADGEVVDEVLVDTLPTTTNLVENESHVAKVVGPGGPTEKRPLPESQQPTAPSQQ